MQFNITNEVKQLHSYPYHNRRANDTIKMMASPSGLLIEGSVLRNLREQGFLLSPDKDNKSEYSPQGMFDALAKYATNLPFKVDEQLWDQAYCLTKKAFCDSNNLINPDYSYQAIISAVKGEKSSGAPEFSKKKYTGEADYNRMQRWLLNRKVPDPCVAFHRVQHGEEGPKNRLVWGYPQSITMAESIFARPLIKYYLSIRTPMVIGRHRHVLSARMVPILNMHAKYGLDFSGFDSTINPKLIRMAFSILQNQINWDDAPVGAFEDYVKIREYFINTPILMPDGHVYIKHRGIPSGSYFTQLIGSIVNYFVIQYVTISLFGYAVDEDKIFVLGDDSLFSYPKTESLISYAKEFSRLGLKINVKKSVLVIDNADIHFLGHIWRHGLVDRDPYDIAKRMAFPEKRSHIDDPRDRVISRVYPYVTDAISAHKIIARYSFGKGIPIKTYGTQGIMKEPITGWKQYLSTLDEENRNDANYLILSYLGILK